MACRVSLGASQPSHLLPSQLHCPGDPTDFAAPRTAAGPAAHHAAHPRLRGRGRTPSQGGVAAFGASTDQAARCAARCTCRPARRRWPPACAHHLRADDLLTSTHRGHGHTLAKGADTTRMMCELFGRATGSNGGKGGSMHIADFSVGMLGANGVVAAGHPDCGGRGACAEARKARLPSSRASSATAPSTAGPFLEGLNWAASLRSAGAVRLRRQPLVGHHGHRRDDGGRRRGGARMGHRRRRRQVDGNDVEAVCDAAQRAARRDARRRGAALAARTDLSRQGSRVGGPGALPRRGRAMPRTAKRPDRTGRIALRAKPARTADDAADVRPEARAEIEMAHAAGRRRAEWPAAASAFADVRTQERARWF